MDFYFSQHDDRIARQDDIRAIPELLHQRTGRWVPSPGLDLTREFEQVSREEIEGLVDRNVQLD